jgi:porin
MRVSIVLAVVLLPLWASLARAQQPPDQSPGAGTPQSGQSAGGATQQSTPVGPTVVYPALNSQPFGTEHLLGDWGGARTWLESHGIYVGLNYYPEVAAIVAGGQRQGIDYTSQIGLSVDLDGQKLFGLQGFALHSVIVQRNGRSASADFLDDDLDAVQQIFGGGGSVAAHLVYLYGEQQLDNGRVDLAGGRLPVGTFFASSPLYCDFVNVIFCGNPHPLPVYPGEPDWPAATWGAQARVFVLPTVYAMAGVFQVNPNFGGRSGWSFSDCCTTGVSIPLEVGWTPSFGPNNLLGHYKVGFDNDSSSYPNLFVSTNGLPIAISNLPGQPEHGRRMYYVFADQMLMRTGPGDTDGLIAFAGFVHADPDVSPLDNQVFGGLVSTASFIGRPQDTLGIATSWFQVSGSLTATQQIQAVLGEPLTGGGLGTPAGVQSHEQEIEAMYIAKVYRGFFVEPDIQYIINPGGTPHTRNGLALGLQLNVTF